MRTFTRLSHRAYCTAVYVLHTLTHSHLLSDAMQPFVAETAVKVLKSVIAITSLQ
jgi:hypothetical protein